MRFGLVLGMLFTTGLWLAPVTHDQARYVVVNGQRLAQDEIFRFERALCGEIDDGRYWLDWGTGAFGLEGFAAPSGRVGAACGSTTARPASSTVQRSRISASNSGGLTSGAA